jgi:O-antigen/teichoic acid export membrane protein
LISNEYSVLYIAFAFVIEALVLFLIYIVIFYKLIYKKVIVNFSSEIAKVLIKDCWPMVVSGLFVIIYMKIDQVMIKEMLNAEALGIYSVAVKLSEAWYFIPTVIATGLFPWVLEAKAASKEIYMNIIKKLFILMNVVSFGAGVFAYLFSYQIIELLFGREYLESAAVLTLHIWGGVFISLGIIRSKWIVIENLQYLIVYFISIGMIVNVILNFILIPQYGIYGAAVATLVSQFIGTMVAPLFFRKIRGVSIMMFKSLYLTFNRNELVDIVKLLKRKF